MPDILAASDMLVLPSYSDPLPLAVLEAMRAGIPVVATKNGGCEEQVQHDQTGYLVPVGNPALLSGAILNLIENPRKRLEMGACGKEYFAAHFRYEQYLREFMQVLDDACSATQTFPPESTVQAVSETIGDLKNLAASQVEYLRGKVSGIKKAVDCLEAVLRRLAIA